jgi:DNA-binding response OmpR family regulator
LKPKKGEAGVSISKTRSNPKLLLVDDEPDITAVLKKGLEQHGFEVDISNDPASVAATYRPGSYDLLLLDIRMPRMSGFELYRKIRDSDADVKVCFLTAFEIYYDEFRRVFPKLHVRCFARKPITPADLRKIIMNELQASV